MNHSTLAIFALTSTLLTGCFMDPFGGYTTVETMPNGEVVTTTYETEYETGYGYETEPWCYADEYMCGNGACIADVYACDGYFDCASGDDEWGCPAVVETVVVTDSGCYSSEYTCGDWSCLPLEYTCDGYYDCPDGDDEVGCW